IEPQPTWRTLSCIRRQVRECERGEKRNREDHFGVARKRSNFLSPDRRNSKNDMPLNSHDSYTLNKIRYSRIPASELDPPITWRRKTNFLTACSALLLFKGIPS